VGVENPIFTYYSEGAGKSKIKSVKIGCRLYQKLEWDMSWNTELKNRGGFK
jgi:hypothetical protein